MHFHKNSFPEPIQMSISFWETLDKFQGKSVKSCIYSLALNITGTSDCCMMILYYHLARDVEKQLFTMLNVQSIEQCVKLFHHYDLAISFIWKKLIFQWQCVWVSLRTYIFTEQFHSHSNYRNIIAK